jgi:SAM-dependent methyltransferase
VKLNALVSRIRDEVTKTVQDPGRVLQLRKREYRRLLLSSFRGSASGWQDQGDRGFRHRSYASYEDYIRHQQSKPGQIRLTDHDDTLCAALACRLREDGVPAASSALCLGARFGGEVRGFLEVGCFAVGIDLRTAPNSEHVLYGDFQRLQFPDACVDFVYTNSLDHAFDVGAVLSEIARVLKPSGQLIVDAVNGADEGHPPGMWECFYWSTTDDLIELMGTHGFVLIDRRPFDTPWDGEHLRFDHRATAAASNGQQRVTSSR